MPAWPPKKEHRDCKKCFLLNRKEHSFSVLNLRVVSYLQLCQRESGTVSLKQLDAAVRISSLGWWSFWGPKTGPSVLSLSLATMHLRRSEVVWWNSVFAYPPGEGGVQLRCPCLIACPLTPNPETAPCIIVYHLLLFLPSSAKKVKE